ncbi:hypothetical protein O1611_g2729 [Lasiodiplodia mahajangana]|uniref:Uncharacterized protein n=1 Tax=Lasiodiplodia mahajangana TaxID=1108764 RepID=A0ACC2JUN0_9PEZI|nr:hypothetical protein O1611_g2729 [Lasiodiplodia mahajangana]
MRINNLLPPLLLTAWPCYAGPMPIVGMSPIDYSERGPLVPKDIDLVQSQVIEKRISVDFPLDRSWKNEVLFNGSLGINEPIGERVKLLVKCLDCHTRGTVTAELTNIANPRLRLTFTGVQAYAFLRVDTSSGQTFSLNLFGSDSPIRIGVAGFNVGVDFYVDLVLSLSEAIDLKGGFEVIVPDGAYLEVDIFEGNIGQADLEGVIGQFLPVTIISGAGSFKADLRLRAEASAEAAVDPPGLGAEAAVGIHANMIELDAIIDKTPTCDLETEVSWNVNVGASAILGLIIDHTTVGPVPTVSTTLLEASKTSSCWAAAPTAHALPAIANNATVSTLAHSASAYSLAAATPMYTATYTYRMTRCGAPGVMNCPAAYQSEIVVTQTAAFYPAAPYTAPASVSTGLNPIANKIPVAVLTSLSTPIVATFAAPVAMPITHVKED